MSKRLTAEQLEVHLMRVAENNVTLGDVVSAHAIDGCARAVRHYLIETDEQRRERFERWCAKYDWDVERLRSGEYASGLTHDLWGTWQAALTWHGETEGGGE